jgi:hypothetical protein
MAKLFHDHPTCLVIKARGWFIRYDNLGMFREGARDSHPLTLTTTELTGTLVPMIPEFHVLEGGLDTLLDMRFSETLSSEKKGDILLYTEDIDELKVLKYKTYVEATMIVELIFSKLFYFLAQESDLTPLGMIDQSKEM